MVTPQKKALLGKVWEFYDFLEKKKKKGLIQKTFIFFSQKTPRGKGPGNGEKKKKRGLKILFKDFLMGVDFFFFFQRGFQFFSFFFPMGGCWL